MARAKTYYFSAEERRTAALAAAMSHPARVRILEALAVEGVMSYKQISKVVPLADGTLSHHLVRLGQSGLVEAAPFTDGSAGYRLDALTYAEASRLFGMFLAA